MRELNQQEVQYIGGGHVHEADGSLLTGTKAAAMVGVGLAVGLTTEWYLNKARVDQRLVNKLSIGATALASSLTCVAIGMGKEYIYPVVDSKN